MEYKTIIDNGVVDSNCRMCSYRCGISVHIKNGKIMEITGDSKNQFSKGKLCIKGKSIMDLLFSPDRLQKPLKKVGKDWVEIDYSVALEEIGSKIKTIKDKYGAKSISLWIGESLGSGQLHDVAHRFAFALGTSNVFSNDTLCAVSKKAAIKSVYGVNSTPDIDNAKSIFIWGANPLASHSPLAWKIIEAKKRGLKVVVIDPLKSTFFKHSDHYIQLRPATDGAIALGIINLLIQDDQYDKEFVEGYTVGFEDLKKYVSRFTPDYVATESGVSIDELLYLKNIIASTAPATCHMVGVGPEHHDNGFNNIRAIATLGAICGSVDRAGGNLLHEIVALNSLVSDPRFAKIDRPIGSDTYPIFYDYHKEGHTIIAMDAMLNSDPYPLRALIMNGANPVLTNPETVKVKEAFSSLDLFVVRDLFFTETAKLADYIIPADSFLERSEVINNGLPQTIALTRKVFDQQPCLNDYNFFRNLAIYSDIGEFFPWENENELTEWILEPQGISHKELMEQPNGLQVKEVRYEKYIENGFKTSSKKVDISSVYLQKHGYQALPVYKQPAYRKITPNYSYPFILITGARNVRYNHSCYHNIPKLCKGHPEALVEMHPDDAAELKLTDGEVVKVESENGDINIKVKIVGQTSILRGFVQIPHGYADINVNELISGKIRDHISGFPSLKSVPVRIVKKMNS